MGERLKPGLFTTQPGELFFEKVFDNYIRVWYREHIINAVQYEKARMEIDLLKNKKKKNNIEDGQEEERRKFTDKKTAASYGARSGEAQHSQELQRLKLQNEELTQKINRLKETLYEVRANAHYELKEKEGQIEKLTTQLEASKREIDDLSKQLVCSMNRQELTDKTLQNEELRQKINRLKDKLYEARANAHYELKDMKGQIEKLTTLLETSIGQNDDLSKRLSKLAGDKLRQGNPDFADLSDRYRPTVIGKMFSEVYDNEWSDAFKHISNMKEDNKVGLLHGIVVKAFNFCEDKFKEQTETIRSALLGLSPVLDEGEAPDQESRDREGGRSCARSSNIQNVVKDLRKEVAMETAENVANQFSTSLQQYVLAFGIKPNEINESLRKYAYKCIELCWLMVVCDPPMALSEDQKDKPYETNIYKPYTKSLRDLKNPVVALPVWPALRLHVGGPLVGKGVAQPGEGKPRK